MKLLTMNDIKKCRILRKGLDDMTNACLEHILNPKFKGYEKYKVRPTTKAYYFLEYLIVDLKLIENISTFNIELKLSSKDIANRINAYNKVKSSKNERYISDDFINRQINRYEDIGILVKTHLDEKDYDENGKVINRKYKYYLTFTPKFYKYILDNSIFKFEGLMIPNDYDSNKNQELIDYLKNNIECNSNRKRKKKFYCGEVEQVEITTKIGNNKPIKTCINNIDENKIKDIKEESIKSKRSIIKKKKLVEEEPEFDPEEDNKYLSEGQTWNDWGVKF